MESAYQADRGEYAAHIQRMKARTKEFALRVVRLFRRICKEEASRIIGRQLLRCATSVGANYRAACRVRTGKEFAAKLRIVCEEVDEAQFWIELLIEAGLVPAKLLVGLHTEAGELTAIFTKSLQTARGKLKSRKA